MPIFCNIELTGVLKQNQVTCFYYTNVYKQIFWLHRSSLSSMTTHANLLRNQKWCNWARLSEDFAWSITDPWLLIILVCNIVPRHIEFENETTSHLFGNFSVIFYNCALLWWLLAYLCIAISFIVVFLMYIQQ